MSTLAIIITTGVTIGLSVWQYFDSLSKSEALSEKYYQKSLADTESYYQKSLADTEAYYQKSLADSQAETRKLERKARIQRTAQYGSIAGRNYRRRSSK